MAASGTLVIRFIGDLKEFERSTGAMGKKLTSMGSSLTKGLTLPLVAGGAAAVKLASDFEHSMGLIEGVVGVSKKQIEKFSDVILTEGPKWGKSPQELADALYFVTSSGFAGAGALDILEKSAKASTAGLGEVSTITDLVTSAINAYGKKNLDAAQTTDILAKAIDLGKLEADEFAGVMGRVLPVASAMGVGFDEVSSAMSAMSMSGTDAAEGATQLRGIFAALLKPTVQANDQLKDMGLSAEGLRDQLEKKGLLSVLDTLTTKFDGNEAATAKVFGNVRALTGVMNMMGANVDTTRSIFDQMKDSTGAMNAAFEVVSETTKVKFDDAISQLKASLIQVGLVMLPAISSALVSISHIMNEASKGWAGLDESAQHFILMALGVVAAVGPVLLILGKIALLVSALANPVGLVVTGIVLLIAAFTGLGIKSKGLQGFLTSLMEPFTSGKFTTAIHGLMTAFVAFGKAILPALQQVGAAVMGALGPALDSIAKVIAEKFIPAFEAILPIMAPIVAFLLHIFGSALVGVIKGAGDVIVGLVTVISGVFSLIAALVHGDWSAAWEAIKDIVSGAVQAVWGAIQVWLNVGILGLFKQGGKLLLASWKGAWDLIKGAAEGALAGARGLIEKGLSAIGTAIVNAVKGFVTKWTGLGTDLVSGARSMWSSVASAVSKGIGDVVTFVSGLPGKVIGALGDLAGLLVSKGVALIQGLLKGITTKATEAMSFLRGLPAKAVAAIGGLSDLLVNAGRALIQGLINGVTEKWNELKSLVSGMGGWIADHKGPLSKDLKLLRPAGIAIMQGLKDGLMSGSEGVKSYLDDLTNRIGKALDKRYDGKALKQHTAAVMKSLSDEYAAVEKVGQRYARWKDHLEAAKAKLAEIKDFVHGIEGQFKDFGNVVGTGERTITVKIAAVDENGNPILDDQGNQTYTEEQKQVAANAQTIIEDLQAKAAKAEQFKKTIADLAAAGLNDTTIQQLLAAGVDAGLATAQAIAAGGVGAIQQINALTQQIADAGVDTGNIAAKEFYGSGIKAAQGLIDGLKEKEPEIAAIANRLARRLAKAIRKALKIKSPSQVFAEIGRLTAAGLAEGIIDGTRDVMKAADRMAQMTVVVPTDRNGLATFTPRPPGPGEGGAGGYGGPPVSITQHFPTNADPQAAADAAAGRIVAALGV